MVGVAMRYGDRYMHIDERRVDCAVRRAGGRGAGGGRGCRGGAEAERVEGTAGDTRLPTADTVSPG